MFIYFFILFLLFIFNFGKVSKGLDYLILILLLCFYCFSYKLGSDWVAYHESYENDFQFRLVEPGFMLISRFFADMGFDFWSYYICLKVVSFILTIVAVMYFMRNNNKYFALMLFSASFATFLYIDCPFRNTISISIMYIGLIFLHQKKYVLFYLFCIIAMTFHMSATPLLILPFCRFDKLSNKVLYIIYFSTFFVFLGGDQIIFRLLSFMPPIIQNKVLFYGDSGDESSQILTPGLLLRLGCLFLMLKNRDTIIKKYDQNAFMFNLSYLYLIFSLASYTVSMLFRCCLFIGLFYVIYIDYGIKTLKDPVLRRFFYLFYLLAAIAITYATLKKGVYTPYENVITNFLFE